MAILRRGEGTGVEVSVIEDRDSDLARTNGLNRERGASRLVGLLGSSERVPLTEALEAMRRSHWVDLNRRRGFVLLASLS